MKKRIMVLVLCTISVVMACAQKYYVYSVSGKVQDNTSHNIVPKQIFDGSNPVSVAEGSRIVLICEAKREMYTIKGNIMGALATLVKGANTTKKTLTPQYIAMLMKKSSSASSKKSTQMQSSATSYRDVDSLLLNKIVEPHDTLK